MLQRPVVLGLIVISVLLFAAGSLIAITLYSNTVVHITSTSTVASTTTTQQTTPTTSTTSSTAISSAGITFLDVTPSNRLSEEQYGYVLARGGLDPNVKSLKVRLPHDDTAIFRAGIQAWYDGSVKFTQMYGGSTLQAAYPISFTTEGVDSTGNENVRVIYASPVCGQSSSVAMACFVPNNNGVAGLWTGGTIYFDTYYRDTLKGDASRTRESIIQTETTHEFGHLLGLGDFYNSPTCFDYTSSIMCYGNPLSTIDEYAAIVKWHQIQANPPQSLYGILVLPSNIPNAALLTSTTSTTTITSSAATGCVPPWRSAAAAQPSGNPIMFVGYNYYASGITMASLDFVVPKFLTAGSCNTSPLSEEDIWVGIDGGGKLMQGGVNVVTGSDTNCAVVASEISLWLGVYEATDTKMYDYMQWRNVAVGDHITVTIYLSGQQWIMDAADLTQSYTMHDPVTHTMNGVARVDWELEAKAHKLLIPFEPVYINGQATFGGVTYTSIYDVSQHAQYDSAGSVVNNQMSNYDATPLVQRSAISPGGGFYLSLPNTCSNQSILTPVVEAWDNFWRWVYCQLGYCST